MTEGSAPQITLAQLVEHMIPSDRLIIKDGAENVLYRGYVATVEHHNIDMTQTVKRFGLATEIFRKEKRTQFTSNQKELPQEVPVESISDYGFSDLEMLIHTRVIVKRTVKKHGKGKMNKEDREKFATGMKTASPMELLEVAAFIDAFKEKMDPADLKFMHSHMGRRGGTVIAERG